MGARETFRRIAANLGLSRPTVARHLQRLTLDGYLRHQPQTGRQPGCYILDAATGIEACPSPPPPDVPDDPDLRQLLERLTALGVATKRAGQLVAEHPAPRIREVLDAVPGVGARSPAGWVVAAIRKNWDVTDLAAKRRSGQDKAAS